MLSKERIEKFEITIDKLIPFSLLILCLIIILDLFLPQYSQKYHTLLLTIESIIISIFVADLIFKYLKLRNIPKFLKKYWFDIIIIFPFFLFFRLIEEFISILRIADSIEKSQQMLHTSIEIQKELKFISTSEKLFPRIIRIIRVMKALPYVKRHHLISD